VPGNLAAFIIEGAFPTIHHQAQLVLAPDEWSQSTRCGYCFEPPSYSAWPHYPVKLNRPFHALKRLRSAIFNHEQPGDQPMRSRGYQYRVGRGCCLDARCEIRSIAEYVGFLASTGTNHHRA